MAIEGRAARSAEVDSIGLRPLAIWDAYFCWRLASDPDVRALSHDHAPPTLWKHVKWMVRWTLTLSRSAYLIRSGWKSVGLVRASKVPGGGVEVGIALLREARGRGAGSTALRRLGPVFVRELGGPLFAVIKAENLRSFDAFARAGYMIAPEADWQRLTDGQHNLIVMTWRA